MIFDYVLHLEETVETLNRIFSLIILNLFFVSFVTYLNFSMSRHPFLKTIVSRSTFKVTRDSGGSTLLVGKNVLRFLNV